MQDETLIGLKAGPLVAGLLGAALSMRAIANATLLNRILSTISAAGAAGYLTPAIAEYLTLSQNAENAAGFFVGLLVLNFTAGLVELSGKFAKDPVGATQDLFMLVVRWRSGKSLVEEDKKEHKDE